MNPASVDFFNSFGKEFMHTPIMTPPPIFLENSQSKYKTAHFLNVKSIFSCKSQMFEKIQNIQNHC